MSPRNYWELAAFAAVLVADAFGYVPLTLTVGLLPEKKGATRAQIALAWLAAQKPWIVSIPGTTKLDHSRENLSSINVHLTPQDLQEIEAAFAKITVHGGRMDAKQMDQIGKD